jgi:hypothetical protein
MITALTEGYTGEDISVATFLSSLLKYIYEVVPQFKTSYKISNFLSIRGITNIKEKKRHS